MHKFKVGDKVLVKTYEQLKALKGTEEHRPKHFYDRIASNGFVDEMFDYCGKIVTIKNNRKCEGSQRIEYFIEEDNQEYSWDYRWLTRLTPVAKVLFETSSDK